MALTKKQFAQIYWMSQEHWIKEKKNVEWIFCLTYFILMRHPCDFFSSGFWLRVFFFIASANLFLYLNSFIGMTFQKIRNKKLQVILNKTEEWQKNQRQNFFAIGQMEKVPKWEVKKKKKYHQSQMKRLYKINSILWLLFFAFTLYELNGFSFLFTTFM